MDINNTDKLSVELNLNEESKSYLLEIAKWAKFLAISGFIIIGLLVLGGLFAWANEPSYRTSYNRPTLFIGTTLAIVYFIIAAIYFFPIYYLYVAARDIKNGLLAEDEFVLTQGLSSFKSHYKYIGILMIIVLSLYLLVFIAGIMAATHFVG